MRIRLNIYHTVVIAILISTVHSIFSLSLTNEQSKKIGQLVWNNECQGKTEQLIVWREGEHCASLGIGHCIWYPAHAHQNFRQSFPELIKFLKNQKVKLPIWLARNIKQPCPWKTKAEFDLAKKKSDKRIVDLQKLLVQTIDYQVAYMMHRLEQLMQGLRKGLYPHKYHVYKQYERMISTPAGMFALVDYLNFKGDGISSSEAYQGHKWGLVSVLEHMSGTSHDINAVHEFVRIADMVLTTRVVYAPSPEVEQKWLPGWRNRIYRYPTTL
jgi:hypothetical protein